MDETPTDEIAKQRKKKHPPAPIDPMVLAQRFLEAGLEASKKSARHEEIQARALLQLANAFTRIAAVVERTAPAPAPRRRRRR